MVRVPALAGLCTQRCMTTRCLYIVKSVHPAARPGVLILATLRILGVHLLHLMLRRAQIAGTQISWLSASLLVSSTYLSAKCQLLLV